jgi:protein-tyrosine phosphatase/membrane-associated phospholipid phosphatase
MLEAAAASVGLSLLFVVVYSGTNWLTSLRSDVGTWYYDWERFIPFVPLFVIPYMSIDLFFAAAPFLCSDRRELRTFSWRIALAIVAAGICFLAMPLKLGITRPRLDGWIGAAFGWFFAADLPYNLCPSLHIALRTILAETYARHTRGYWRVAAAIWFSLIGFSALLTYQHHVVDVAGGFLLATVCFYLVPSIPQQRTVTPNRRIGVYYLIAAVAMTVAALLLRSWAMWLLWPAAACFIATIAYFGFGPAIYRKTDGRLPLSTRLVLAPLILGQKLSLRYYRRQCRAWDEAAPNVWIGGQLFDREAADAIRAGVTAVLDLTAEFSEAAPFLTTHYLNVPILDLTAPTPQQLDRCIAFIDDNARRGIVYIHCKIGYSRSAAVVGCYLLANRTAGSPEEAMARLGAARPSIILRPEAIAALSDFSEKMH